MRRKVIVLVAVFLLAAVGAVVASHLLGLGGFFGLHHCPGHDQPGMCWLRTELDLDSDQEARLEPVIDRMLASVEEARKELARERRKLAELIRGPELDKEQLEAQLDRIAAVQRRIEGEIVTGYLVEVREILTREQFERFAGRVARHLCDDGPHHCPSNLRSGQGHGE